MTDHIINHVNIKVVLLNENQYSYILSKGYNITTSFKAEDFHYHHENNAKFIHAAHCVPYNFIFEISPGGRAKWKFAVFR